MEENPKFTVNDDGTITVVELLDGLRVTSVVDADGKPTAPEGMPASIAREVYKDGDVDAELPEGYKIPELTKDVKKKAKARVAELQKEAEKAAAEKAAAAKGPDTEGHLGNQVREFSVATLEQRLTRLSDTINGYARNSNEFRVLQSYMADVVKSLVESELISEKFGRTLAKF